MSDERLYNIAMLSLHAARTKAVNLDRVVDMFVSMYPDAVFRWSDI